MALSNNSIIINLDSVYGADRAFLNCVPTGGKSRKHKKKQEEFKKNKRNGTLEIRMIRIKHGRKLEGLAAVYQNQKKLGEDAHPRPNKSYLMSLTY